MSCSLPEFVGHETPVPPVQSSRVADNPTALAQMTTFGVGGKIKDLVLATSEADIVDAVRQADEEGLPVLVIGGGSNILASDAPFDGVVVRDMRQELSTTMDDGCGGGQMRVTAGVPWDDVVVYAIEQEWMGLEALSGIPGSAGAAPVQNIGAYGQEVAQTIASIRVYDREEKRVHTLFLDDLKFGYRSSILKSSMHGEGAQWGPSPRWIVLSVDFHMRRATLSEPIRYAQLAQHLGVDLETRVPATDVRAAVLDLRRSKGMVLDDGDRDTYSAGSFFTNPVISEEVAATLPDAAPRFGVSSSAAVNQIGAAAPMVEGQIKTSAAWLIAHAGFAPGYGDSQTAALSSKHSLALTNRGGASADELVALARTIRDGVLDSFGIELVPEPVLVGLSL